VNKRTEERAWFKHVLRLTMCNKGLRKLLNCNIYSRVEKRTEWMVSYTLVTHEFLLIFKNRLFFYINFIIVLIIFFTVRL